MTKNNGTLKKTFWSLIMILLVSSYGFTAGVYVQANGNAKKIIKNEIDIGYIKDFVKDNNKMLKKMLLERK